MAYTVTTAAGTYKYGIHSVIAIGLTGQLTIELIAGETISAHRPVFVKEDGNVYHFVTNTYEFPLLPLQSVEPGNTVTCLAAGILEDDSFSFTASKELFISPAGLLIQTPPTSGTLWICGQALTDKKIFWFPTLAVELS